VHFWEDSVSGLSPPRDFLLQLQAMAIAGSGGKITYLDEQEVRAAVPGQDYNRAWPMWRANALARMKLRA